MSERLTYIEIDVPRCTLTYGTAPCAARLGETGADKCFNTRATCQDRDNISESDITIRFAVPTSSLPLSIDCIPSIDSVDFSPGIVSLGTNIGQRASLKVTFRDHRDSDTGAWGDNYLASRDYDPFATGTFFGKFRSRQPYMRGKSLRWISGQVGQSLSEMETRHFVVDDVVGPSVDGKFEIVAKDVLKLADDDRAQAPALSNGYLASALISSDTMATMSPSGIGAAEYPTTGYVCIGGREVCAFTRDPTAGNDANCLLLLHFGGADASTTFTDSSTSARTGTAAGNAQIDTAQSVFGETAGLFDGTGDYVTYPDSNDWTFSGNFTIECRARCSSLAATRCLWGHGSAATNQYFLSVSTGGALTFSVISSSSTIITCSSSAGAIVVNTWYHIAVVRNGNNFVIYKDGVSVATTTDADAIPNYAGTFRVGADGASANVWAGWIDELRISNVARWTTAFTVPVYSYASSSDALDITRAQFNTEATAHNAQDRVQLVLSYSSDDVADIISDLLQTYAGISSSYISISDWQNETASFLGVVYTATITEPTPVKDLISELIEQAALALWWDDINRKIRLQVLRGVSTDASVYSDAELLAGSLAPKDQSAKRISRVQTYFAQIDPTKALSDLDNYRSSAETVDADAETDYGGVAIKRVTSRWIPALGRATAEALNQKLLSRYRDPPRLIDFSLLRDSTDPILGGGYTLSSWVLQGATGLPVDVPVQIVSIKASEEFHKITAEEILYTPSADDLTNRLIIVDVNTNNFNMRTAHDSLYSMPESGDEVTCRIPSGIIVGSSSTTSPAFDVGTWPAGVTLTLQIDGRIQGCGGNGGQGRRVGIAGTGGDGGDALYTRYAIDVECGAAAEIWGGGGGGGGGGYNGPDGLGGGGGGGGAGSTPGTLGADGKPAVQLVAGTSGTTEAGGNGAIMYLSGSGGDGGDPGNDGVNGYAYTVAGGAGGAAGSAIDGVSYVTVTSGSADIRGAEIN